MAVHTVSMVVGREAGYSPVSFREISPFRFGHYFIVCFYDISSWLTGLGGIGDVNVLELIT